MAATIRIPFDSLALAAVAFEAQSYVGARVQAVWQPDASTVVLGLYRRGAEALFLLSCDPNFARAHFVTKRPSSLQPIPEFGKVLKARLVGSTLISLQQIDCDRILEMQFQGAEGEHTLLAELMGRHANTMLIDAQGRLVAAAKWVGAAKSKRPVLPGKQYALPPHHERPSLTEAREGDDLQGFAGASPFLIRLLSAEGPGALARLQSTIQQGAFTPVIVPGAGAYPISVAALGFKEHQRQSISVALEQHYDEAVKEERVRALKHDLLAQLRRVILAREAALHDLDQARQAAATAGHWQMIAELILAHGQALPEGAKVLEALDYNGQTLTINLDPAKGYLQNAQALFDRARRAKAGLNTVSEQSVRLREDHKALLSLVARIEAEASVQKLELLRDEASGRRWLHERTAPKAKIAKERPYEGHRIRELLGPGGFKVLYGENAESNDYLTLRVARPNDLWLHVRGHVSAHVVIQAGNQPEKVGRETLLFAARLAAQSSALKHSSHVPVDYTLRKYVRKPRGAAKGFALYTHEKTLDVDPTVRP